MTKFWLVMIHEYLRHVRRRRFILTMLSLPLFLVAMLVFTLVMVWVQFDARPIGIIDLSGRFSNPVLPVIDATEIFTDVPVQIFADEESALKELKDKEIQAFYVINQNYMETGSVRLVALESPSEGARSAFRKFMEDNLVAGLPEQVVERLDGPDRVVLQTLDESRSTAQGRWTDIVVPIATGIIFLFVVFLSSGYLMRSVVEEKENRTMEIMITSVRPTSFMAGKVAGNLLVGFTQLFLWLVLPMLVFSLLRSYVPGIKDIPLVTTNFWLTVMIMLPAFIFVAAGMAAIGATVTEAAEASIISGWFTLPISAPYWMLTGLIQNPNGLLAIVMSFFPFTAPVTMPIRIALSVVPAWQIGLCIAILWVFAGLAVWLAGRAFKMGMLRYDKPLKIKELFRFGRTAV